MNRFVLVALILGIGTLPVQARLEFDRPDYLEETTPKQRTVEATFSFKNAGKDLITIEEVRSSCGCTAQELKKKRYAPGETGELKVILHVPSTPGEHIKYLYIRTDEPQDLRTYSLTIGAKVREYVRMDPRFLVWEHGETPVAKTVTVKNVYDQPIQIKKVESTSPNWEVRLETVTEGQKYIVHVTPPADTKQVSRMTVKITTDFPAETPFVFPINARVDRKRERPRTNWLLELYQ